MRSLYDDIIDALTDNTFTIPNVTIREPSDESPKVYPIIVVSEINNVPQTQATVNGEQKTHLSYQLDVLTTTCTDSDGTVLTKGRAGRRLVQEASDLLDSTFAITRRSITPPLNTAVDVVAHIWRGDVVLDSYGYAYRP